MIDFIFLFVRSPCTRNPCCIVIYEWRSYAVMLGQKNASVRLPSYSRSGQSIHDFCVQSACDDTLDYVELMGWLQADYVPQVQ